MKLPTYQELEEKLKDAEKDFAKLKSEAKIFRDMYSPEYTFSFETVFKNAEKPKAKKGKK
jgi:archaellum component FlaC